MSLIKMYGLHYYLFAGILFLSSGFIRGQTTAPDSALQQIIESLEGQSMTLAAVIDLAKKNSTAIGRAEALYMATAGNLKRQRGYFDPGFYFNFYYNDLDIPTSTLFAGADILKTQETTAQTGLTLNLPIGTQLQLGLNTYSINTNSQFAFLNPEYNGFGSLSLRQPLLEGFTATGRRDLTFAEFEYEAAKALYDQEVISVISEVEIAYWNLYTAERNYGVQKLVRDRASEFLTETELREEAGLVGPEQVANAKTFLAEQEIILIDQEEELDKQSDLIAVLTGTRPEPIDSRFKTVDVPPSEFPIEPVDAMIDYAIQSNLQLKAVQEEINAANTLVDAASWQVLPSLDLVGSYSGAGLGGDPQAVIFGTDTLQTTTSGSYGDMLSQIVKRDFPGWSIGFELSVPIGLRSNIGEKERLEALSDLTEQRYTELTRDIEKSVRQAHRELIHGNRRLNAATDGVEAAQEQVRIGRIEFQNGRTTAFELVRLGEDFAKAQRRYSEALVRTVNAVAKLKQLTSGKYPDNSNN
ncbi:MAG: TolC family protein [Ignavibacteriaceae bacterium]|nr:TolC family protein [Ignavibacteriaceae bacterium]